MKEYLARVDDALIDRLFQPLADWMDRCLALGTNRAARTAVDLASLAWILAQAGTVSDAIAAHNVGRGTFLGIVVVLGLWAFTILRNVFQRADRRTDACGQANPLRPGMQLHRTICVFWMIGLTGKTIVVSSSFGSLALLAMGVFTTAAVYIGACTNRPPGRCEISRNLTFAPGCL